MAEPPRDRPKLIRRLEARREEHRRRSRVYRALFGLGGALVLLAGVVMLVTPGPAFVLIPLGLAMLAMEFAWAERALERAPEHAYAAQRRAARTSRAVRRAAIAGGVLTAAAI